jgi:hypothetical protein
MAQSAGKKPEALCPHCGSPMAKSPAGQQILQKASQAMAQKGRTAPQGGMPRPQTLAGMAPGAQVNSQDTLRQALMQRILQGRGR